MKSHSEGRVLPCKKVTLKLSPWEQGSYSLFVACLPMSVSKNWLLQLFGKFGVVMSVFISRKVRRESSFPFAFVRF